MQERKERKISGNNNLKLQYHRTFGYFLAVSKSKACDVPWHWIRRQTLANEERFITPQLKEREGKIFQTKARSAYKKFKVSERHRHRYEVNNKFRKQLEKSGLVISGVNKDLDLVEIIELKNHPWFVGVQFHPELKSRVLNPHPLFNDFIASSVKFKKK